MVGARLDARFEVFTVMIANAYFPAQRRRHGRGSAWVAGIAIPGVQAFEDCPRLVAACAIRRCDSFAPVRTWLYL